MPNSSGGESFWKWVARGDTLTSLLSQLYGTFGALFSSLFTLLSQQLPSLTRLGLFGFALLFIGLWSVSSMLVAATSRRRVDKEKPTRGRGKKSVEPEQPFKTRIQLIRLGACAVTLGLLWLGWESRPQVPVGINVPIDIPVASYRAMRGSKITGKVVVMPEYLTMGIQEGKTPILKGMVFEQCKVVGPAVLSLIKDVTIEQCVFGHRGGGPEDMILEHNGMLPVGTIGLLDCTFRQCEFIAVSYAGTKAAMDLIRSSQRK